MQQIKHDWFQTASHVVVTIFAKKVKPEDIKVNIQEKSVEVAIVLSTGSEYQLNLDLADTIVPSQSKYELMSTKIELKLQKHSTSKWPSLENTGAQVETWGSIHDGGPSSSLTYPSSSKKHVDFDKMKVEEEKLEGDAALNQVFSQIYKGATDEQRKAMLKSFEESSGTVLSTNWDEVGKDKVKGSAPNGMVMKDWAEIHHGEKT